MRRIQLGWIRNKGLSIAWICDDCDKFRCNLCTCILTNKLKCYRCGKKHGAYTSKTLPYCQDCYEYIKNGKNYMGGYIDPERMENMLGNQKGEAKYLLHFRAISRNQ